MYNPCKFPTLDTFLWDTFLKVLVDWMWIKLSVSVGKEKLNWTINSMEDICGITKDIGYKRHLTI